MYIAGVDEVGRGAWAGPIVAAAVVLTAPILGLSDSKKLSVNRRRVLSKIIRSSAYAFAIAELSPEEIDNLGLAEANRLVMRMAIDCLPHTPDLVRVDGFSCGTELPEEVHIRGDALFPEISAASIIAKVYRDELMHALHNRDDRYGFNSHVGYGTVLHKKALLEYGVSQYHRKSFSPMKSLL